MSMNVFRVIADLSHTVSKCILIWAIHSNSSAEGVSLITQSLYALVFTSRYLDLFWSHPLDGESDHAFLNLWNFLLKIFYISSSFYIIFLMIRVYGRTHERERAWRFGWACLGGSLALAPFVMLAWGSWLGFWASIVELLWTFSEILESVCILPQLLLLRQTSVPTVLDSFYLLTLGSYRFFYILNWILRGAQGKHPNKTSVIFGVIQTCFYLDFAWVYWSRQRVKLRHGAVVDADDLSRGWLVRWVSKRAGGDFEGAADAAPGQRAAEEGSGDGGEGGEWDEHTNSGLGAQPRTVGSRGGWGKRGISVSADDEDVQPVGGGGLKGKSVGREEGKPEERAGMLAPTVEDGVDLGDEDEDDDEGLPPAARGGIEGGSEWK